MKYQYHKFMSLLCLKISHYSPLGKSFYWLSKSVDHFELAVKEAMK